MVGLPCLVSQCAKLHVTGWTWAVFTCVYLGSCTWPVAIFTLYQREKQWVCIIFCANLGKSAMETLTMIQQAFGDQRSRVQVFQWHARFKTCRTSVDDDEHTGRRTSCTTPDSVAWIQELVCQDRHQTIHKIPEEVGIGYGTCQRVLTEELGMHRVTAIFVPRILTADQKQQCISVCIELNWSEKQNGCHPPPTVLPWFGTLWLIPHPPYSPDLASCDFFLFPKMKLKLKGLWLGTIEEIQAESQRVLDTDRKGLPGSIPEMEETVGPVSTCGRELLRGWRRPIGLMVSFMIFTGSVRKILDTTLYLFTGCS